MNITTSTITISRYIRYKGLELQWTSNQCTILAAQAALKYRWKKNKKKPRIVQFKSASNHEINLIGNLATSKISLFQYIIIAYISRILSI